MAQWLIARQLAFQRFGASVTLASASKVRPMADPAVSPVSRFPTFGELQEVLHDSDEAQLQAAGPDSPSDPFEAIGLVRNFIDSAPPDNIAALIRIILCAGCLKSSAVISTSLVQF